MKTENLLLLAVAGLAIYYFFFKKDSGSADWGSGGGGGGGGSTTTPSMPIVPGSGPGTVLDPSGNVVRRFTPPSVVQIPAAIVANVPAGVVSGSKGHVEGLLIKGTTSSLFITPGSKQVASFMNKAIAGGKTFPLNQKSPVTINPSVKNALSKTNVGKRLLARLK